VREDSALLLLFYVYCSKRRIVGGGGAGSPQMLQNRALARFICPQGQGRNAPEAPAGIVAGGTGNPGGPAGRDAGGWETGA
jgi:hypothetical protein